MPKRLWIRLPMIRGNPVPVTRPVPWPAWLKCNPPGGKMRPLIEVFAQRKFKQEQARRKQGG